MSADSPTHVADAIGEKTLIKHNSRSSSSSLCSRRFKQQVPAAAPRVYNKNQKGRHNVLCDFSDGSILKRVKRAPSFSSPRVFTRALRGMFTVRTSQPAPRALFSLEVRALKMTKVAVRPKDVWPQIMSRVFLSLAVADDTLRGKAIAGL